MQIAKLRQDFDIPDPEMQKVQIQQIPASASSQLVHSIPQPQPITPVVTPKAAEVDDALYGTFDVFED